EVALKLVEIGLLDTTAAVGRVDGFAVSVGDAEKYVGRKVKARLERVLDGTAYAVLVDPAPPASAALPVTAESEAEKPTRRARARKADEPAEVVEDVAEAA